MANPVSSHRGAATFGAIILAAGASTRLGRPKQLIQIDGAPLVARAAAAVVEAGANPVVVVVGSDADLVRSACAAGKVSFVENQDWREGMASSIRAGIQALVAAAPALDAALIAVCDQPAFAAGAVARLLEALATPGKSIAAARYAGRNGTPAIFRREWFSRLSTLTGDRGAQALFALDPASVASVDLPELEHDVDTPADLERPNP